MTTPNEHEFALGRKMLHDMDIAGVGALNLARTATREELDAYDAAVEAVPPRIFAEYREELLARFERVAGEMHELGVWYHKAHNSEASVATHDAKHAIRAAIEAARKGEW